MTRQLRQPVVRGLHRGAGTSTLAAALHAQDGGHTVSGVIADIVVCGADPRSLALADALVPAGPRPVLALRLDIGDPARARLRALEDRFGAVVVLPTVARWHGLLYPLDEAAGVLGQPAEHLPRALRAYAAALRHLAAAVLRSGQLGHPAPPSMSAARTVRPPVTALPIPFPTSAPPTSTASTSRASTSTSADHRSSTTPTPPPTPPRLLAAPRPVHLVVVSVAGRPPPRELTVVPSNRPGATSAPPRSEPRPAPAADRTGPATPDAADATTTIADQDDEALEAAAWAPVGRAG